MPDADPFSSIPGAVSAAYPKLGAILNDSAISYGDPPKGQEKDFLEFYPPWEADNPTPGKIHLQVYDKSLKGQQLQDMIAADTLHYLGSVDPRSGNPVDGNWYTMKRDFLRSMTPKQKKMNVDAYQQEAREGETRQFDQWMQESRIDAYLRGGIFPSVNPEWQRPGTFTRSQADLLNRMKSYIQRD